MKKPLPKNIKSACCQGRIIFHCIQNIWNLRIDFYEYICSKCDDNIPERQGEYLDNLDKLENYNYPLDSK